MIHHVLEPRKCCENVFKSTRNVATICGGVCLKRDWIYLYTKLWKCVDFSCFQRMKDIRNFLVLILVYVAIITDGSNVFMSII